MNVMPASNATGRASGGAGSLWLHRMALVTAGSTGILVVAGGLVTSHDAGLAVPDWPTSYGYNLFLYPPAQWVGGILYEHGHRLIASGVGLLTVALAAWIWKADNRTWMHVLGAVAIFAVILQGVLGGLRVIWLTESMAVVHACLAQAFFLLTVALAVFTSPRWRSAPQKAESFNGLSLRWMSLLLAVAVYAQVILGAVLRHSGTVIGGPLHAHLAGAVVVGLCVVWVALRVFGYHAQDKSLTRPAGAVVLAFVLQLALGFGSLAARMAAADLHWPTGPEIWLTTAHLAVGALMLASSGMIMLQAFGRFPRAQAPASAPALTEQVT